MGARIPKSLSLMLLLLLPVVLVTGWSLWSLLQATPAPETATVDREVASQPAARPTAPSPRPTSPADTSPEWRSPRAPEPGEGRDTPASAPELVSQANPYILSPAHGLQASCPVATETALPPPPAPAPRPLHAAVPAGNPLPTTSPQAEPSPERPLEPHRSTAQGATPPPPAQPATPEAVMAGQEIFLDSRTAEDRRKDAEETQEERHRRSPENRGGDRDPDREEPQERDNPVDPEDDD